ncbi:uncharacterized protein LOC125778748 [Bactrocera dorsalis]|uniref:Uncharacterized protein LOC125778748 n=1 Tax=Bactrocera dorsalis TaxID=27457 RepID=A0ABM3JXC3_BACDO|nr:uncharacterized protein LOC125778748 [Bactrocera dorsalis]
MTSIKFAFALLAMAAVAVAKPSYPLALNPAIPDHFELAPPVLPPTHFHAAAPAPEPWLPEPHFHAAAPVPEPWLPAPHLIPAPAPFLPAPAPLLPAPAPLLPAPAPILPAPAALLPAPAPVLPAPALLPAPVVHHHHHVVPAPLPVPVPVLQPALAPPVLEPAAFVAPSYRAVLGPKTTTHHVSVGYAFPTAHVAKIVTPHAHLHSVPVHSAKLLAHHHHHSLF